MTRLKSFALTAFVLLANLFCQNFGEQCSAQSRTENARSRTDGTNGPILRRATLLTSKPTNSRANSIRANSARANSVRNQVRTASATENEATLAPTAMKVDNHPLVSQAEPSNIGSISDNSQGAVCCDSCGGHDTCCCKTSGFLFDWSRADLWVGSASFGVPANILNSGTSTTGAIEGAFGFQEGINFGSRVPSLLSGQMGSQLGVRFIQSQLFGSAASADQRYQVFVTTGLFRRVDYGVQAGLVVDYLHDDWIYKADLLQLRGELSYLLSPCHELGFRFTDSQRIDDATYRLRGSSTTHNVQLASLDTYRGFYRFRFNEQARSQAEVQAGWTEDSGAILGLTLNTPLQNQVGLTTTASYLIPPSSVSPSYASEGWNIGLALVWTPGRKFGLARDYYRPLFDVADNGSLISKIN